MRKKFLSVLLAASLVISMCSVSALATGSAEADETVTDTTTRAASDRNELTLWYDEPVSGGTTILSAGSFSPTTEDNYWQQLTLPIGNSYMGANVYGEIGEERLTFNQKTLWNGGPSEDREDYNGGNREYASNGTLMSDMYQQVVDAFLEGSSNASSLCNYLVGDSDGYGAYQSWGDIYLDFEGLSDSTETTGYERGLDMEEGLAYVDFTADGTTYHREYFISYPDNVLAIKLTADGSSTMSLNVSFPVDNAGSVTSNNLGKDVTYTVDAAAGTIVTAGELQDNQMKMNSVLQVVTEGTVTEGSDGSSLDISGADEVVIFVSADTDYANDYPTYRTGETDAELAASVASVVAAATEKGYDDVKASHQADYKELFGRLDLDLGQAVTDKSTDVLLSSYKADTATDAEKRLLEVLLYQYGRYLTIASSRDGDLPSNLQGVWQNRAGDANYVPWGSDYHMNVNLQMNYWPTYSANLAECATPLIDYVESLREPGRVTAATYYGIVSEDGEENGFTAHTQNTPFGWTCPGWSFSWGWSPAAVCWILQNCWEYYEYTGDVEYMKEYIYPMMREEAVLYDQLLVDSGVEITLEDGTTSTRLVSAPTYSPEHGPYTLGNTYENTLIWQLYEDTITAAEILGVDEDKVAEWKETQSRLSPIEIGDSGQIKEWYTETTLGSLGESGHRHMSHLLGLFPGDLISVDNDMYIDAAKISLTERGLSSTGWGMGQRINAWARTGDGNTAYQLIENLFSSGIYPNLWDAHPPFQIDGNFGYTSGVDEMLMQSNMGYINLLPALPDEWADGHIDGIVARGNFELEMNWTDGTMDDVTITSNNGGEAIVQYDNIYLATVMDQDGNLVATTKVSDDRISFDTEEGKQYTITDFVSGAQAPTGLSAERTDDSRVALNWNASVTEGTLTYNVYRQIDDGEKVLIASGLTGTEYTDATAYTILGELTYEVTTVSGGEESEPCTSATVVNYEIVDDQDESVVYTGSWGDWNDSGDGNYNDTIKYLQSPEGGETATLTFTGTGISLITCLNSDRGELEITIDGVSYGTVDTYSSSTSRQYEIFTVMDLSAGEHTIVVTATNTSNSSSSGTKVELDGFKVWNLSAPELADGEQSRVLAAESERVMVQWEAVDGAETYYIYDASGTKVAESTGTYAWIEGLDPETEYVFTVKAVASGSEVGTGIEISAVTLQKTEDSGTGTDAEPEKVTDLAAYKGSDDSEAKLTWTAAEGAASYQIWIGSDCVATTSETEYLLTGLVSGQKYTIKIVAVSEGGATSSVTAMVITAGSLEEEKSTETENTGQTGTGEQTAGTGNDNSNGPSSASQQASSETAVTEGYSFTSGNFEYKVTSVENKTVTVTKLINEQLKKAKIGNTVLLSGATYKVTAIADSLFKGNKKITSVTVGKNVVTIGKNAFANCTKLKKVVIQGNSLKQIGAKAFSGSKKLKSITIKSKVLSKVGKNAFKNINAKAVIKVPKAKYKAYVKLLSKKGQSKTVKIKK